MDTGHQLASRPFPSDLQRTEKRSHGVSAKVLSARLKKLATLGVVERTVKPTSPPTVEYALTELGGELKPAIEAIVAVGQRLKERRMGKAG